MDKDQVCQASEEERREIVERYNKGQDEGSCKGVDPNDIIDEYGFIHKGPTPQMSKNSKAAKHRLESQAKTSKWMQMINQWEKHANGSEMASLIYKGIPNNLRGKVYRRLLGIDKLKQDHEFVYQEKLSQALESSPHIPQIDVDLNRTYRNNVAFRERYSFAQKSVFFALAAYSIHNPQVGYCQGMSEIAAVLFMYLYDEEDVFWALTVLISDSKFGMHGYFIPKFPKLKVAQAHHDRIVRKFLPKVHDNLNRNGITPNLYTTRWFLKCLLDSVPFHLAVRLWDIWMLEGEKLLIAMMYNMVKMYRHQLVKINLDRMMTLMQTSLPKDFGYSDDEVIKSLQTCMQELEKAKLSMHSPPQVWEVLTKYY